MRDTYVSEDTQIQVTNVYRRNKTKRDKMKRTFNFVLKGMMLSSVLVSSVVSGLGGALNAQASGTDEPPEPVPTPDAEQIEVQDAYHDEQARILNLKNANKVLEAAIRSKQLDSWVYENIMKSLISIDVKLDIDQKFVKSGELIDVMMKTESLLSPDITADLGVDEDTETTRDTAYTTLQNVMSKLKDIVDSDEVEIDLDTGGVATYVAQPTAKVASATNIAPDASSEKVAMTSSGLSNDDGYTIGGEGASQEDHEAAWDAIYERMEGNGGAVYTQDSQGDWTGKEVKTTKESTPTKTIQEANDTIYNDFQPSQYWAKDMKWMIDKGYITGYVNQKHPTTGKHGSWLNPGGQLTESQMLSVLLRYNLGVSGFKQMQKETPNPKNNWSYNLYLGAEKIGMVTKGSKANTDFAGKQVTRGQLAQALVSMHYGKSVSLKEAVDFMYANKITGGTDATKGETLDNFAPNSKLSRAHISTFLKRFHDVKASGNVKDVQINPVKDTIKNPGVTKPPSDSVSNNNGKDTNIYSLVPKAKKTDDVVGKKINTKFGERSYGAKTQAEYDATMKIVEKEFKDGKLDLGKVIKPTELELKTLEDYFFNGKTATKDKRDPNYRTNYNQLLLGAEESFGAFKGKVKTTDELKSIKAILEVSRRASTVHADHSINLKGVDPVSAYDLVVKGLWDCTSDAYYTNAILDQLGIDSFVLESPGRIHAFTVMKLYGDWYVYDSGTFVQGFVKMSPEFLVAGDNFNYAPNGGLDSLPSFLQKIYRAHN